MQLRSEDLWEVIWLGVVAAVSAIIFALVYIAVIH